MSNSNELQKVFKKRNFYTMKDSGNIFSFALILPLVVGLMFAYIAMAIASGSGVKFPEDVNVANYMFENFIWFAIIFSMITQIVFLCIYLLYHKICRISYKATQISFKKANPLTCILCAVVGVMCVVGFVWLIEGCFGQLFETLHLNTEAPSLPLNNVGWLFVNLLLLGVVPAICEELLFRGIFYAGFRRQYSVFVSVLLSALTFALMHQNITQFIYPFLIGIILCVVYEKTGNLLYTIIIHMFNNIATVILTYLLQNGIIHLTFFVTWWGVLCAILLAGVTVLILWLLYKFYLSKKPKLEKQDEGELTQSPPIMVGKFSLVYICATVLAIVMIVINAI